MAYDKLAQKGRYGDTEIRNVAGRKSHVNRKESNLIDLYGMLGERLVRDAGAGTINPKTGLPEYHGSKRNYFKPPVGHPGHHTQAELNEERRKQADRRAYADAPDEFNKAAYATALEKGKGEQYLRRIGIPENKIEYFESNVDVKGELDLAQEARTLSGQAATLTETQTEAQYGTEGEAYTGAQKAFDIGKAGVGEQFRSGSEAYRIGGLAIGEGERAAGAQYSLGMEQAGLQAGRSLFGAKQQADVAAAKSGFATQGTVTGATKRAQKGVFQDYTMQQKQLAEAQTSAMTGFDIKRQGLESDWEGTQTQYGEEGIAMAGLTEAQRSTQAGADIAYTGAMGGADIDRKQADLTYKTKKFNVGQRAADEWWETYGATNV